MEARQRPALDPKDDDNRLMLRAIMPQSGTILYGAPERISITTRAAAPDDGDDDDPMYRRVIMPDRRLI